MTLSKGEGKDKEPLTYLKPATVRQDGKKGFLYLHTWYTGFQTLIFESRDIEKRWVEQVVIS